ncbi:MAG: hypothetical protein HOO86_06345 [Bacteroidales bacterium]|nr:hypothetical protein [Bacteroidales bacterium]
MLVCIVLKLSVFGQIAKSNIEIREKNDFAGEFSKWFNTGDDIGETQSLFLSANFFPKKLKYNFKIKVESTEYSTFDNNTPEPRDLRFIELNNFQFCIDNNRFKDRSWFYSLAIGLMYIQGNRISIGAVGEQYYLHKWIIEKIYSDRYWIYNNSKIKDFYVPYLELKYGYRRVLFKKGQTCLISSNNVECRIASKFNFTGIGTKSNLDLRFENDRFKMHTLDFEFEGFYLTNIQQYNIAYFQLGLRLNFIIFSTYLQLNKPISKYLNNPYIKYDDMEILFNYGLVFYLWLNQLLIKSYKNCPQSVCQQYVCGLL